MRASKDRGHELRLVFSVACAFLSLAVGGVALAAEAGMLPPLTEPATSAEYPGKVIWAELATPDLAASERFYGALLGWKFTPLRLGKTDYALATADGVPVAGLIGRPLPSGEQREPAWLPFLSVTNAAQAGQKVTARGGRVLLAPRTYANRGQQAVFADPQGAVFAVLHSTSGDPADALAAPGEWIWSVLMTRDPAAESDFYQTIFGFQPVDVPDEGPQRHVVIATNGFARAAINPLPSEGSQRNAHWLEFVRVPNVAESAQKAMALGARVVVTPRIDRHGGQLAVITDPNGAALGLLEWTSAADGEGAQ